MKTAIILIFMIGFLGCNTQKLSTGFAGTDYYYFNPDKNKLKLSFKKDSTYLLQALNNLDGNYFYEGVWELKKYKNNFQVVLYKDYFRAEILDTLVYYSKKDKIALNDYVLHNQNGMNDSLKKGLDSLFVEKLEKLELKPALRKID